MTDPHPSDTEDQLQATPRACIVSLEDISIEENTNLDYHPSATKIRYSTDAASPEHIAELHGIGLAVQSLVPEAVFNKSTSRCLTVWMEKDTEVLPKFNTLICSPQKKKSLIKCCYKIISDREFKRFNERAERGDYTVPDLNDSNLPPAAKQTVKTRCFQRIVTLMKRSLKLKCSNGDYTLPTFANTDLPELYQTQLTNYCYGIGKLTAPKAFHDKYRSDFDETLPVLPGWTAGNAAFINKKCYGHMLMDKVQEYTVSLKTEFRPREAQKPTSVNWPQDETDLLADMATLALASEISNRITKGCKDIALATQKNTDTDGVEQDVELISKAMRDVTKRNSADSKLEPFTDKETRSYLRHCWKLAEKYH